MSYHTTMSTQVIETKKYVIVRIPKVKIEKGSRRKKKVDWGKIAGALRGDKRFRGMTSVEVQHRAFEI
ncbi:MAG: hypothetical protein G01um101433_508 [Parcubacteria group bacterium Gr01-1014_33]|nr:MAG: hypothetical protein G01um101433_508 [Parcubacteria group bacterium Gr01-1014_33]